VYGKLKTRTSSSTHTKERWKLSCSYRTPRWLPMMGNAVTEGLQLLAGPYRFLRHSTACGCGSCQSCMGQNLLAGYARGPSSTLLLHNLKHHLLSRPASLTVARVHDSLTEDGISMGCSSHATQSNHELETRVCTNTPYQLEKRTGASTSHLPA